MKNFVLIGYMGSGKTTVGQKLAVLKGFTFVDTDEMIVKQQKKSINEIFASQGEEAFRQMETELLRQLIADGSENRVIATGGGMPIKEENRPLLSALGTVVYLKATPTTIYNRIKYDKNRPLLQCENPRAKICEMIDQRNPIYEAVASMIVNVGGESHLKVAKEILARHYNT